MATVSAAVANVSFFSRGCCRTRTNSRLSIASPLSLSVLFSLAPTFGDDRAVRDVSMSGRTICWTKRHALDLGARPPKHRIEGFMHKRVRKAVFPVAGLGTRFLPATKAMPKEMLPIVDKPLIHYAVEEAKAAGIEQFFFVTGRAKSAIDDHFDRAFELEATLRERGKPELAQMVRDISGGIHFSFTRQNEALGLGHAVLTARELVGDEPFAVLLGDVIMESPVPATRALIEIYESTGQGAITVQEVPREELQFYGVISSSPGKIARWGDSVLRLNDMVEKPKPEAAPSNLGVSGRYVLPPEIFDYLDQT